MKRKISQRRKNRPELKKMLEIVEIDINKSL